MASCSCRARRRLQCKAHHLDHCRVRHAVQYRGRHRGRCTSRHPGQNTSLHPGRCKGRLQGPYTFRRPDPRKVPHRDRCMHPLQAQYTFHRRAGVESATRSSISISCPSHVPLLHGREYNQSTICLDLLLTTCTGLSTPRHERIQAARSICSASPKYRINRPLTIRSPHQPHTSSRALERVP